MHVPISPCRERPELFTPGSGKGERLTGRQRLVAAGLCRTRCPVAEFAICASLTPEPGTVMAGVAYSSTGRPVHAPAKLAPAPAPEGRKCAGENCAELLPESTSANRLWCSETCRESHRCAERKAARAKASGRTDESQARRDADAIASGALSWDRASYLARLALVTRHHERGLTDREIAAHIPDVTNRQIRHVRNRAGLRGYPWPRPNVAC